MNTITISAIKADIDGIGRHTRPSDTLLNMVKKYVNDRAKDLLLLDFYSVTMVMIYIL